MSTVSTTLLDLDPRRRRIHFRSWHRGMREVDLVLGAFVDREIATMNEDELDQFEALLAEDDGAILKWITGEASVVPVHDTPLFARILLMRPSSFA